MLTIKDAEDAAALTLKMVRGSAQFKERKRLANELRYRLRIPGSIEDHINDVQDHYEDGKINMSILVKEFRSLGLAEDRFVEVVLHHVAIRRELFAKHFLLECDITPENLRVLYRSA